ncbi:hypothetical protein ACIQU5_28130 [Streptomyces sp. NPDC090306]|uniref:hypothetical protein n=1 Tax=Streptomyces sp. NPDC090306 TaxID=3365961 RepID=UPI00380EBAE8
MSYLLITPNGDLTRHTGPIDWDAAVGPEGHVRVRLNSAFNMAAYVNDCGFSVPDRYPRNIPGTCLLQSLGAAAQPYAGTIAVVGWDAEAGRRGYSEIAPLAPHIADNVEAIHGDVLRVLAGDEPRELSASWGEQMREIAEDARTAPAPGLTVRTVDPR